MLPHTSHSHHIPLGNCFGDILIPISSTLQLLWPLTKKCSLAHFRKKLPSDLLLIWQICSAMSASDLINFWDQKVSKWPFSGDRKFCNIYLTQEMRDDWTMNIKQNVMAHTRITHDKFYTKKSKMAASRPFFLFVFFVTFFCLFFSHYPGNIAW